MNRQERRKRQKLAQTEIKYAKMLYDRQSQCDIKLLETWMICISLAVADAYGDDASDAVEKIMPAFQMRLHELTERPLEDMAQELCERTGLEFIWPKC